MRKVTYEVMADKGRFQAIRWAEWPHQDQAVHPPIPVRLGTFATEKDAQRCCLADAGSEHLAACETGGEVVFPDFSGEHP